VAEEIIYGEDEVTTGASNDLQQVRNIARRMVAQWGFAFEELGNAPLAWESANGNGLANPKMASGATEKMIDEQVKIIVQRAYDACFKTLSENRALLERMTNELIEKETIDYDELQKMRDEETNKKLAPA